MTPSRPTLSMASAITSPMTGSLLAEMVAICCISARLSTGRAARLSSSTTAETAASIPRFRSTGLPPCWTLVMPSVTIAWARTVAVVVPSPATSLVWLATSLTSCAPMFSKGSGIWISRAMVTPSLVMVGGSASLSSIALRPIWPSEKRTALASLSTPDTRSRRASSLNLSSFAIYASPHGDPPPRGGRAVGGEACLALVAGTSAGDRLEIEAEVLGRVLRVREEEDPVVQHHHAAVVRGHHLLEVVSAELPAEGLAKLVEVEVDLADAVDADHRGELADRDPLLAGHDVGDGVAALVVHQGHAGLVR